MANPQSWMPDNAAWLVNPDVRGRYQDEVSEAEKRYAAIRRKIKPITPDRTAERLEPQTVGWGLI